MEIIKKSNESRYENGVIYVIRSPNTRRVYIGSTCTTLCKRFYQHRIQFDSYLRGGKNFISSFDIIMAGNAYIELLEAYPCKTKQELTRREGELIRSDEEAVNLLKPGIKIIENKTNIKEDNEIDYKRLYEESEKKILELRAKLSELKRIIN